MWVVTTALVVVALIVAATRIPPYVDVVVRTPALSEPVFAAVVEYLAPYDAALRTAPLETCATAERRSLPLEWARHSALYALLDLGTMRVDRSVPVEYRMYEAGSPGMGWHRDAPVRGRADAPYYEVSLTLHNTSDGSVEYIDARGRRVQIRVRANTAFLVRPDGATHRATPLRYGERRFLKYVVRG